MVFHATSPKAAREMVSVNQSLLILAPDLSSMKYLTLGLANFAAVSERYLVHEEHREVCHIISQS